jgi:pyruvyltransferase
MIPIYYYEDGNHNVGDLLPLTILPALFPQLTAVTSDPEHLAPKLVSVGSVLQYAVQPGDVVWGTGLIAQPDTPRIDPATVTTLALRGPRARMLYSPATPFLPDQRPVYGDPGLLISLTTPPYDTTRRRYTAYVPHYIDNIPDKYPAPPYADFTIDITSPLPEILDKYAQCHTIVSTSLHGLILAEATRVPSVVWLKSPSKNIVGGTFKFLSYFEGTGRYHVKPGGILPHLPLSTLTTIQTDLVSVLEEYLTK